MTSLQRKEKGFTIIELLIVIVVIGILAALVITTFTGIQQRARNTERETDIKALHSQLEAYYAQNGAYPALADLNTTTLKGLDAGALTPPGSSTTPGASAATINQYQYLTTPGSCDTAAKTCTAYVLSAQGENATYSKNSLN